MEDEYQSISQSMNEYEMHVCSFMRACGSHEKQWKDGRQHDAQEYLRSILEAMQVTCLPTHAPPVFTLLY